MRDENNTLAQHRWVRIMTDYCAAPVWDKDGLNVPTEWLPVEEPLREALVAWEDWFDQRPSTAPLPRYEDFVRIGRALACEVKRRLPDWTVVYFDPEFYDEDVAGSCNVEISAEEVAETETAPRAEEIRAFFEV